MRGRCWQLLGHTFEVVRLRHTFFMQFSGPMVACTARRLPEFISTCCQLLCELVLEWNAHWSAAISAPHLGWFAVLEVKLQSSAIGSSAKCLLCGDSLGRVAASQAAGQVEVGGRTWLPRNAQCSGGRPATLVHWQGGQTGLLVRTVLLQSAVQPPPAQSVCRQFWGGVRAGRWWYFASQAVLSWLLCCSLG
jgi:hypothetical protein